MYEEEAIIILKEAMVLKEDEVCSQAVSVTISEEAEEVKIMEPEVGAAGGRRGDHGH